ncbi:efflux RND transporter permease subunit [Phaeocystidibacter luteus]|uniref:MMPL family transporter n=1 Tax=Phaeocystidibacter luteus TaxID=911197 RepID=A0A6N6RJB2_9FLAO|nr:efflux RND transporter permease subunit [Phaeocystidibacter luteus]KAB2807015.1 MMPL family transporter [Phaeocystidibacter luteus]
MWTTIARLILRRKLELLSLVVLATAFMGYMALDVKISYKFSRILPVTDPISVAYDDFRTEFGEAGNAIVLGASSKNFWTPEGLAAWQQLADSLIKINGVENILGVTSAYNLTVDEGKGEFVPVSLMKVLPSTQEKVDSIRAIFAGLPFYRGVLYDDKEEVELMVARIREDQLYNANIIRIVEEVKQVTAAYEEMTGTQIRVSGLPYIRMANTKKVEREVYLFIFLTIAVTAIILLFFLKSIRATGISLIVVVLGVIWSFGLISSFGYEISLLSSLIPPLVIVIGVPNAIFLINKYHAEYRLHGNKILALQRVIRKIGNVTLLTNTTTALGFAAFILTDSITLVQFGVVASVNILVVFCLSLIIIPIVYTYLTPPKERHYKHLDQRWVLGMVKFLQNSVVHRRKYIYALTVVIVGSGIWGMVQIHTTGSLTEDFGENDPLYLDLKFLESKFHGVVPMEIIIDTKEDNGVERASFLRDLSDLQASLDSLPQTSRSLSIADFVKFSRQAFMGGNASMYSLPTSQERSWIVQYLPDDQTDNELLRSLVDSTGSKARITLQVPDLPTPEMELLLAEVEERLDWYFPSDYYETTVTGASVVFLAGTEYLIKNLILSLLLAIAVISIIMAILFGSARMVIISIVPNLIPLLMTAGLMGFLGIPLKPSTILVFSIAFGISVDDTLHFLAKYRQELKTNGWKIGKAVLSAIHETGISMFYTSMVLFFGFSMFIASDFGGTVSLGILVSLTLFFAMFANLLILPAFLMSVEKWVNAKSFNENIIEVYEGFDDEDEEEETEKTES